MQFEYTPAAIPAILERAKEYGNPPPAPQSEDEWDEFLTRVACMAANRADPKEIQMEDIVAERRAIVLDCMEADGKRIHLRPICLAAMPAIVARATPRVSPEAMATLWTPTETALIMSALRGEPVSIREVGALRRRGGKEITDESQAQFRCLLLARMAHACAKIVQGVTVKAAYDWFVDSALGIAVVRPHITDQLEYKAESQRLRAIEATAIRADIDAAMPTTDRSEQ